LKNVLVLVAALAACNNPPATPTPENGTAASTPPIGVVKDPGEKVLSVNGTPVGMKELELVFMRMRVPPGQLAEFAWSPSGRHVTEEYALVTALFEEAVKQELWNDPEVQRQLAFSERQVLAAAMREKMARATVNDAAVAAWFEKNKARFDKPEVKARHIRVADETLAKDLLARIQKGEDFAEVAKVHSADQVTAPRGGDVGWFQEQENRMFGAQAFAAEKGALIGPVKSTEGYHVIQVLDKRDSTPLDEVRPLAEAEIAREQAPKVLDDFRTGLKIEWVREPAPAAAPGGAPPHGPGGMPPGGMPPGMAMPPGAPGGAPHPMPPAPTPGGAGR
jgi:peptidyl-prolyl cis-trans isomerase C